MPKSSGHASALVVQITDSHLFADRAARLLGVATRDSLAAVVDQVLQEQRNVDLVLATGDISQDGSLASYRAFLEQTQQIAAPMAWVPGNHDERQVQQGRELTAENPQQQVLDLSHWRVIMLDSSIAGQVEGRLAADQLQLLKQALGSCGERHVLVCLHHPPVTSGCAWLDRISLTNDDELFACLADYPQVKAVLCGHIHQQLDVVRQDVRVMASPSTCIQFKPDSEDFALDQQPPGYRWLRLHADGQLDTGVSRVAEGLFMPEAQAGGY